MFNDYLTNSYHRLVVVDDANIYGSLQVHEGYCVCAHSPIQTRVRAHSPQLRTPLSSHLMHSKENRLAFWGLHYSYHYFSSPMAPATPYQP
jgi:hypothetical protein